MRPFAAPDLTLAVAQASASTALNKACRSVLLGGFASAALGASHQYPSSETDQSNLTVKAGASLLGQQTSGWTALLKCQDGKGAWARASHTPAQLHQVLGDFQAFHDATTTKLDALNAKVTAAQDPTTALGVVWA